MSDAWSLASDATALMGRGSGMSSPSETFRMSLMQQQTMDNLRYAAVQQGMPFMNLLTQGIHGKDVADLGANARYAYSQVGGMAAANGLFGGGSAFRQMHGIMQAVGGGGFNIGGANTDATARMYGQGGLTAAFSRQLYDQVEGHFFGGTAGSQLHRTHGLDRSDIGTVFDQLKQRGSFAGMNIGEVGMDAGGNTTMKLNDTTANRIKEFIEDSAATLGSLREVFGDQSMDVLMQEAERISGMSFRGPGSARAIRGRVENAATQARMFGQDPRAAMEFDYNTTVGTTGAMVRGQGGLGSDHYRSAAAVSPYITMNTNIVQRQQQEAANAAAEQGRHYDVRSKEEIAALTSSSIGKIESYEKTMMAADYAADAYGISDSGRQKLDKLRMQWATGDKAAQQAAREGMRDLILQETGEDTDKIAQGKSMADMKRGLTDSTLSRRGEAFMMRERASSVSSFDSIDDMLNTGLDGKSLHKFYTTFDAGSREGLYKYWETGSGAKSLEDYMQKNGLNGLGMSAQDVRNTLTAGGSDMRKVESEVMTRRDLMNLGNRQGDRDAMRDFAAQYMADNAFGGNKGKLGLMDLIGQGLGGKLDIDSNMLFAYGKERMADQVMSFGMSESGGAVMDEKQKAKMLQLTKDSGVNLAKLMGVSSEEEAFKAMETQEGMGRFMQGMAGSGMVFGLNYDKDGKSTGFNLGSSKLSREGTREIEEEAAIQREMKIMGFETREEYDAEKARIIAAADPAQKQAFQQKWGSTLSERILADESRLENLVNLTMDSTPDTAGDAFGKMLRENAAVWMPALSKKEEELRTRAEGQDGTVKEGTLRTADRIKEMREQLTRTGSNQYLGHLTVDNGSSMALYAASGGAKESIDRATP
jgi:hypothetical protein